LRNSTINYINVSFLTDIQAAVMKQALSLTREVFLSLSW